MGDVMSLDKLDKVKADTAEILDKLSALFGLSAIDDFSQAKHGSVHLTGNQATTVADVTGKGVFYGCAATGGGCSLIITIDGVPYQDSGSRAGFVSPQMKAYEGGGEWGFTDDSFVRSTVLSPCPIPFEQSLKLELTGVGTGSWFHYMYTLL